MGMQEERIEQLSPEAQRKLGDAMGRIVMDASKASSAVVALSEMMQEYSMHKIRSNETVEHIEYGMWLCGELSNHQLKLLERLEVALNRSEFAKGPESLLADCPEFSDSLSLAARSVSPARF